MVSAYVCCRCLAVFRQFFMLMWMKSFMNETATRYVQITVENKLVKKCIM